MIEINGLSFQYPDGKMALRDISLLIAKGEKVGLVGPNGAGKSTLLLHFNGILRNNRAVKVMDKIAGDGNLKWLRRQVGLVFQEPDDQLFCPTVFDDVAFGPVNLGYSENEVRNMVADALKAVGMSGYENRSSHHLSVGEKKKAAIATVLAMAPRILVLDEPTSNLDPRSKWQLIKLLQSLPMTLIVASHDLEAIKALCTRVIILDGGRLVADGEVNEIISDTVLLQAHGLAPV